jgi:hypothetical protein
MSVYLLAAQVDDINPNQRGQNRCCSLGDGGKKTGTIRLLTPSAPLWKQTDLVWSLGLSRKPATTITQRY